MQKNFEKNDGGPSQKTRMRFAMQDSSTVVFEFDARGPEWREAAERTLREIEDTDARAASFEQSRRAVGQSVQAVLSRRCFGGSASSPG